MVRQKTIEKYRKIRNAKMADPGLSIRALKKQFNCSEDTVRKGLTYVPNVPKKIRTVKVHNKPSYDDMDYKIPNVPNKKGTKKGQLRTSQKEKTLILYYDQIIAERVTQYGAFKKDDKKNETINFKHAERMRRLQIIEKDLTERFGVIFDHVFQRKANQELKLFDKEIREMNGGH